MFYDDIKYVEKKNTKYCRNDPEHFETLVCIQNIEDTWKIKKNKKTICAFVNEIDLMCICWDLKQSTDRQSSRNIQNLIFKVLLKELGFNDILCYMLA